MASRLASMTRPMFTIRLLRLSTSGCTRAHPSPHTTLCQTAGVWHNGRQMGCGRGWLSKKRSPSYLAVYPSVARGCPAPTRRRLWQVITLGSSPDDYVLRFEEVFLS
jgi:hypothetical protein